MSVREVLKEKKRRARDLIQQGQYARGGGMAEVVGAVASEMNQQQRFLTKENTIVKDGYVYVKINDIPFGNV